MCCVHMFLGLIKFSFIINAYAIFHAQLTLSSVKQMKEEGCSQCYFPVDVMCIFRLQKGHDFRFIVITEEFKTQTF